MTKAAQAPDQNLAIVLRRLRERRGTSREALAYHAGITGPSLARIELGQANPSWATVRGIAAALEVTLAELVAEVEAQDAASR
jgi:transcriptional regulator with XRE-family HTH domain